MKVSKQFDIQITIESPSIGKRDNSADWERTLIEKSTRTIKRFPAEALPRMLQITGTDIWKRAERKKWRSIPPAIVWYLTRPGEGEVTLTPKLKRLGFWLHHGTEDHEVKPQKAKALHWVNARGQDRFSKGHKVRGIKATNFFQYSAGAKRQVNTYLNSIQRG